MSAIHGGAIGALGYDEIVAVTYSGCVVGLTTEPRTKTVDSQQKQGAVTERDEIAAKRVGDLR